jgi:peroxiredoxin
MKIPATIMAFAVLFQAVPAQVEKDKEKPADAKGYAVGSVVADFTLNDLEGKKVSLKSLAEGKKYVVIDFWSRECPAAKACEPGFVKLNSDFSSKGVALVHVASNKKENKADADVAATKEYAKKNGITFPVLLDVENKIADVFGAQTTPHVYIVDAATMKVVYAGAFNDNVWKPESVKQQHAREALDLLLAGKPVATASTEPKGCTIKRVRE